MKVMITGAAGQLGQELVHVLEQGRSEIGRIPAAYAQCEVVAVDVDVLDITELSAVQHFVAQELPDVILNCAAMTNVDGCETAPDTALRINAVGVRNLALAATAAGAKLVQVSTDYVFDGNGTRPYAEWDAAAPVSVYGKSKWLGEQYARAFCAHTFIVRTAWLYGYHGGNFVKTMLKRGAEKGTLTVVDDQRGNPTHANDLAHHLLKLACTEEYGTYHCTGSGECTWYAFASRIIEEAGIACTVTPCTTAEFQQLVPPSAPRPSYSALDNAMLRCTVGDEMRDWRTALASYFERREGRA